MPRLVWDPVVHKALYGEDLSFFLMRLNAPTVRLVGDIEAVLKSEGIVSFCIYKVFGFYDALIRVWFTAEQRTSLIDALQDAFSDAELIREFRVDKAYYDDWSVHRPDLTFRTLQSFLSLIEKASNEGDDSAAAAETLLKRGLLHRSDGVSAFGGQVASDQLIKVYFALSRSAYHGPPDLELDAVRSAVLGTTTLQCKSIYTGDGFADYLVKGLVARYGDVDKAVSQLLDILERRRLSFRPMTLLVANQDAPEADIVDVSHVDVGSSLTRLVRTLDGDVTMVEITAMSEGRRQDVRSVFESYGIVHLDTEFERFFLGMLEAGIRDDAVLFTERLSFIMRLEAMVRSAFVRNIWPQALGPNWVPTALETADRLFAEGNAKRNEASRRTFTDISSFTLSDYVRVADKLITADVIDAESVGSVLGEGWSTRLRGVFNLRNDVAHGNLYEPVESERMMKQWKELTMAACAAGEVYNCLAGTEGSR